MQTIAPSAVNGTVKAPASKSMLQRAFAAALLAEGTTTLYNVTLCDDSQKALEVIQALGAKTEQNNDTITVKGGFNPKSGILDCGEAGLCIRMFSPVASLSSEPVMLSGAPALSKRPMEMLEIPLRLLGVDCITKNGFLPVIVKGPIKGGLAKVDGSVSSQFLTGLLLVLPKAENDSELLVENLKSKPYIDMTIALLREFGIKIKHKNFRYFKIAGNQLYKACEYHVEGDWSGAAFLLTAGAIAGKVEVHNLNSKSFQADRAVIKALKSAGAAVKVKRNTVTVQKDRLKPFAFDATHCPDLFPPLTALAACCNGKSYIKGTRRLIHKESNRAEVLKNEFGKLNVQIQIMDDQMIIHGGAIDGGVIHSNNDHRIAMAGAVAGLAANDSVKIEHPEAVNKSYPGFFSDLQQIIDK